jgi:CDP-diglyceride synthetase
VKLNKESLKFIGGAIIVAAAALIMFPGFLQVAFGLWRIFLVLIIAGGAALFLAYATMYIKRQKKVKD